MPEKGTFRPLLRLFGSIEFHSHFVQRPLGNPIEAPMEPVVTMTREQSAFEDVKGENGRSCDERETLDGSPFNCAPRKDLTSAEVRDIRRKALEFPC